MAKKFSLGKWIKRLFYLSLLFFIGTNFVIYNHAYYFTHFVEKNIPKVTSETINQLSLGEKIQLAVSGTEIPKPRNSHEPDSSFKALTLGSNPQLHAWWIPTSLPPKGVMILFHGYSACKSSMLNRAAVFQKLGYHCFLVDFRGHGDSEGLQTTIGFHESKDVKTAYDYIKRYYDLPISLLGTSMGAVSILKSIHDFSLDVEKVIAECPFGSLSDAVYSRFENLNLPTFLLPELLLFWGGMQNNMSCWEHNTVNYAKKVSVPTLIIYGAKDPKVRRFEVDAVFKALQGPSKLEVIENAAHDHLMADDPETWTKVVWSFLES